jgi:uncharacterized repeat protein (TIGR02543 family)
MRLSACFFAAVLVVFCFGLSGCADDLKSESSSSSSSSSSSVTTKYSVSLELSRLSSAKGKDLNDGNVSTVTIVVYDAASGAMIGSGPLSPSVSGQNTTWSGKITVSEIGVYETFCAYAWQADGGILYVGSKESLISGSGSDSVQIGVGAVGSVTYDGNGATSGTAPTDSATYASGTPIAILGPGTLARTNYAFSGWTTNNVSSGSSYAAGDSLKKGSDNVILYAVWTAVAPTITSAASYDVTEGSSVTGSFACDQSGNLSWYVSSLPEAGSFYVGGTTKLSSAGSISSTNWSYSPETGGIYNYGDYDDNPLSPTTFIYKMVNNSEIIVAYCGPGTLSPYTSYATMSVYVVNNDTGAISAVKTISFNLIPVDDPPVITNTTDPIEVPEAEEYHLIQITATDVDTPTAGVTYYIIGFPAGGNLYQYTDDFDALTQITPDQTDNITNKIDDLEGRFYFQAPSNFSGKVTITVEAWDMFKLSAPVTLTLTPALDPDDPPAAYARSASRGVPSRSPSTVRFP